jgi:hypothetical protein
MTHSKNFRQMLSVAVVTLGLAAPLRSESRVTFAMPADGTHQQSTPLAQVSKSAPPAQSDVDPNSPAKPLSLSSEQAVLKLPQVTYDEGQLTIVAENVPLSTVLDAVRRIMGANIEIPPGAANQLIWVRSGPGPARRVLRDVLDGTELDYVIQASETDVDGVRSVFLTTRSKGGDTVEPASSPVRGVNRRSQQGAVSAADSSSEMDVAPEEKVASSSEPGPTDPTATTSAQPTPNNVQLSSLDSKTTPAGSTGGSSEHTIQQLQTLYQQRRQMQMLQNQKLPTAN